MRVTDTAYYMEELNKLYPKIPRAALQELCIRFMSKIYGHIIGDHDIMLISGQKRRRGFFKLKIYRRIYDIEEANLRARKEGFRIRAIRKKRKKNKAT